VPAYRSGPELAAVARSYEAYVANLDVSAEPEPTLVEIDSDLEQWDEEEVTLWAVRWNRRNCERALRGEFPSSEKWLASCRRTVPRLRAEENRLIRALRVRVEAPARTSLSGAPGTSRRGTRREVRGASRRSSARSGDSGDDDPHHGPPLSGERVERRTCAATGCQNEVTGRADRRTCSPACKKRLQREELRADQKIAEQRDAERRLALVPRRSVPLDPLDGVSIDVLECLYENRGLRAVAA
jgi:hypothetical protein